jgi:hypothetical protein
LTFAGTASKTYAVEINNTTANAVTVRSNATVLATISGNTTSVAVVNIAAGQVLSVYPSANGVTQTCTINYVRELPGNHLRAGTWASPSDAARASYVIQTDPALYDVSGQPELVTNGGFDSDISGWTASRSSEISWQSGSLLVKNSISSTSGTCDQSFATEIGKAYRVTAQVGTIFDATVARVRIATAAGLTGTAIFANDAVPSSTTVTYVFVATGTTTFVTVGVFSGVLDSSYCEFDNISVKEIPAAQYKYALSFSGVDDYYSLLNAISITESMTVVRAFKRASAGSVSVGVGNTTIHAGLWFSDNVTYVRLGGTQATGTSSTATGSFVDTAQRNGSAQTVRRNGTQILTASAPTVSGSFVDFGRGNSSFNSGEISFLAVFHTELTGADLTLVEQIAAATNGATLS